MRDEKNNDLDYEHFSTPFLLNVEKVYSKIRNLKYRYLPADTLFPTELTKYEPWVLREVLQNCIAHQDYELHGKVTVLEKPDELTFSNLGHFIPGSIENVIQQDAPPEKYRNPYLTDAMVNLNMIDTIGSGIKKAYRLQKERFFPLPDYDLSKPNRVSVKIFGKILDEKYTRLLMSNPDLDIETVYLLDQVQKKKKINKTECAHLKKHKLVEGRFPNIYLAADVASIIDDKTTYIKNRGFDNQYYQDMIIKYLKQYAFATRSDIDKLLMDKLPDSLIEKQKKYKVNNILNKLSNRLKLIENQGSDFAPKWVLFKQNSK